jgi:hypothetical protein
MNNEYVIVNKTALLKMREELIHVSDYQRGQMDLIDAIVSSQSTPLIPELQKTWNAAYIDAMSIDEETYEPLFFHDYISNLKLDV